LELLLELLELAQLVFLLAFLEQVQLELLLEQFILLVVRP
jgi:hypothetical protein